MTHNTVCYNACIDTLKSLPKSTYVCFKYVDFKKMLTSIFTYPFTTNLSKMITPKTIKLF